MPALEGRTTISQDNSCGCCNVQVKCLQRCANPNVYVVLYGLVGCILSMTSAYFSATITTLEKRFRMPTQNVGYISAGSNLSQMVVPAFLGYYAGRGHRPRWIGFGLLTVVVFCFLSAAPHWIYGPGEYILELTEEFHKNTTHNTPRLLDHRHLCHTNNETQNCPKSEESTLAPQVILFVAQVLSGIGGALFYTLGVSYLDDNTERSRVPALLSVTFFINMLGPSVGYALASFCLRLYIVPQLHSLVANDDPHWLGAWWLGWLLLAGVLLPLSLALMIFPKQMPRQSQPVALLTEQENFLLKKETESPKRSLLDMMHTFRRLLTNTTFMGNTFSSIFYFFGYTPYWIFTPKYIEIQYRTSAAASSMATGSVAFVFTAIGVLVSGYLISRFRPTARSLATWNILVGALTVLGMVTYAFIGCAANSLSSSVNSLSSSSEHACNAHCNCEFVPYSPVCASDGNTYISACHAGCQGQRDDPQGSQIFYDCACVGATNRTIRDQMDQTDASPGLAHSGACPIDCWREFHIFLVVMCLLKLLGASSRTSNLLVSLRCIPEQDKTAAMGLGMMLISAFTFIPSPIFFGWLIDRACMVWGATCTHHGNCWIYDQDMLRYTLNFAAAAFVFIGVIFDVGVWYRVKELNIFDPAGRHDAWEGQESEQEESAIRLNERKNVSHEQ